VGLLFAGSADRTLANPIEPILQHFHVTIDDGSGAGNSPPTASFTFGCTDLTCVFDGSESSDGDGSVVRWDWDFGDGAFGSGETDSHTYEASGIYTAALTVTDDAGATDGQTQDVRLGSFLHAGNLDRASTKDGGGTWTAWVRITVHDANESAVGGATVTGTWDNAGNTPSETHTCTTITDEDDDQFGMCQVSYSGIPNRDGNIVFRVENLSYGNIAYNAAENHDDDGNSNGTSIRVFFSNSDDYKKK
jgi:hypothetical protein